MGQTQPVAKGRLVNFKPLREVWSDFSLSDGSVLRVKVAVIKVTRMQNPDNTDAITPTGEPVYMLQTQNIIQVITPAEYNSVKEEPLE
jgi:hypothetical protein